MVNNEKRGCPQTHGYVQCTIYTREKTNHSTRLSESNWMSYEMVERTLNFVVVDILHFSKESLDVCVKFSMYVY